MKEHPSIAIIGAGLAGIALAQELKGFAKVTLFEKSRGVGGRMSNRRHDLARFDHGAQFFTARSKEFRTAISAALELKSIEEWTPKILTLEANQEPYKREWFEPHFRGASGMNSLAKTLAKDLSIQTGVEVKALSSESSGWVIEDQSGCQSSHFDWVVCSAPAPQATNLLPDQFLHKEKLKDAVFSACFALMLGFDTPLNLNFEAAVIKNPVLAWLSLHNQTSLLVHSQNHWASDNVESDLKWVESEMLGALENLMPEIPKPNHQSLHRWRFARCETPLETDFLLDTENRLAAVGDWCRGNRVEDAFLSGYKLGQWFKNSH
ncbi:MAG: NAD(P)/FAD-dependent oxidoreductase [Pseudohongiellaceae bacterium]